MNQDTTIIATVIAALIAGASALWIGINKVMGWFAPRVDEFVKRHVKFLDAMEQGSEITTELLRQNGQRIDMQTAKIDQQGQKLDRISDHHLAILGELKATRGESHSKEQHS